MMTELKHYGTLHRSGRYPWGSGEHPDERGGSFLWNVRKLERKGLTPAEVAKGMGISTADLIRMKSIDKTAKWLGDSSEAYKLSQKGYSNVAIGKRMHINESQVRELLNPSRQARAKILTSIANQLQEEVDKQRYIQIGPGTELYLGVAATKKDTAVKLLELKGYKVQFIKVPQPNGKFTSVKVLTAPDVLYNELTANSDKIGLAMAHSEDHGETFIPLVPPKNIDSSRIFVRYAGEGGELMDGAIQLRRGVPDISLGDVNYAQVRIGVDGTKFMKGMAIYSDDIPEGYDVVYNTNKPPGSEDVFKPVKGEAEDPFGAITSQRYYTDENGDQQLSLLNKVGTRIVNGVQVGNEEGAWADWKESLSSQILSKQNTSLAKKQLGLAYQFKQDEFNDIMKITNPAVQKVLLATFAEKCDKSAVDLDAAAMSRQGSNVLIPLINIKDNEVYAPNFNNGETVVLIRHPHGGIFEIPQLTVNNKNPEGLKVIGDSKDAVGINSSVAAKLSGADFDGDAVIVIPNNSGSLKVKATLNALKDFTTSEAYPGYPGMPKMTDKTTQREMGIISNLITDMTIAGAPADEIARAIKHSMVVIDAEKHNLNYKLSAIENGIAELKQKYQTGGASTLISRAGSELHVPLRKEETGIDPVTGEKVYKYITGETYINDKGKKVKVTTPDINIAVASPGETYVARSYKDEDTGKWVKVTKENIDIANASPSGIREKVMRRTTQTTKLAEASDAFNLSSGTQMEKIYAEHSNMLKGLANMARLAITKVKNLVYSHSARIEYDKEVQSLNAKLALAFRNKPLERKALLIANKNIEARRRAANPKMTPPQLKKMKSKEYEKARNRVGAKKEPIQITDREWEAIQAGAITHSKLMSILFNTKVEALKIRAMPKEFKDLMTRTKISTATNMLSSGYTRAEIAEKLGVSVSTLDRALD